MLTATTERFLVIMTNLTIERDYTTHAQESASRSPASLTFSSLPAGSCAPAGPRKGQPWPIESAIRTQHGVAIVKTRWVDGPDSGWMHKSPSHSRPGEWNYTTEGACSCWGFIRHRHCWHVSEAARIERSLHRDCYYALRFMRPSNSTEDYCYGLSLLSRMGIDEAAARAIINQGIGVA